MGGLGEGSQERREGGHSGLTSVSPTVPGVPPGQNGVGGVQVHVLGLAQGPLDGH